MLRGIHYKDDFGISYGYGFVRKAEFIRRHGRAAFDALPPTAIHKRGRRILVAED